MSTPSGQPDDDLTIPSVKPDQTIALTTAFVQPDGCESHWTATSFDDDGTAEVTVVESEAISSCYPSGWDGNRPKNSRFHFSPAVCPSSWTYYQLAEYWTFRGKSTALCCNSGYTFPGFNQYELGTKEGDFQTYCRLNTSTTKTTTTTTTTDQDDASNTSTDLTVRLHEAWVVTWDATDRSTLTPELPILTSGSVLPTWTAGQVVSEDDYIYGPNGLDNGSQIPGSLYWFLVVGIPIIFVSLVSCCVSCCVHSCIKKKKKKREREAVAASTTLTSDSLAKAQK